MMILGHSSKTALPWASMLAGLIILAGCSKTPQPDSESITMEPPVVNPLFTTKWTAIKILNMPADAAESTLTFSDTGKVSGSTGCNNYSGAAEFKLADIDFGMLATTRKMCEPAISGQEIAFLEALEAAQRWQRMGSTLILTDAAGERVMELTEQP